MYSSRDIFLVCHVIKKDHLDKGGQVPITLVTILPSLVAIGTVVEEIWWPEVL